MEKEVIYKIEHISKSFPGVKALDDISFDIYKGEIHSICGENGAGKSTLMNILSGLYKNDEGSLYFHGKEVKFSEPKNAIDVGIAMIHQELSLSPNLSVGENIFQGRIPKNKHGLIDKELMYKKSGEMLECLGASNIDPKESVKNLSVSCMQLVEIAKAMSLNAKLLIMDEPTSSLTDGEIAMLTEVILSLKYQGISIIYISHKLDEIMNISDRITVMRDGKYIKTLDKNSTSINELISLMVGRKFNSESIREFIKDYKDIEAVLEVQDLNDGKKLKDISFKLYKGEVLGLTGLVGAGRSELVESVFGARKIKKGKIFVNGRECNIKSTSDAIDKGMALVPEGRKVQGLFLKMTVKENMMMASLKKHTNPLGIINKTSISSMVKEYVSSLRIKTPSCDQKIINLSGGNQQKTIIARWLANNPNILFLDEPTHGVDIGAKYEIYNIINDLAKLGVSIVFISSELPEILNICDRILVMYDGELKGELMNNEANQENIMEYATNQK